MKRFCTSVYSLTTLGLLMILMISCTAPSPTPIKYGEDECEYCRMTIVDHQFGTELVTTKGKVFKFDSIECLAAFHGRGDIEPEQVHSNWVTNYLVPEELMPIQDATFVQTEEARSPMGMGLFGFPSESTAREFAGNNAGAVMDWESIVQLVSHSWLKGH